MLTRAFNFWAAAALVFFIAATASAQQPPPTKPAAQAQPAATTNTPTFELSGGYQVFHVPNHTFPFGLNVDAARHYGSLGLVGEVGWAYDSDGAAGIDVSSNAWNFGVGGRWTGFSPRRAWPFVQLLVGAEVLKAGVEVAGVDISDTETSFMVQPGVGVNFIMGDGWGIVGQIDYRRTFFDEPDNVEDSVNNQFRVFIGGRMILD